jgi:hypothetical protein
VVEIHDDRERCADRHEFPARRDGQATTPPIGARSRPSDLSCSIEASARPRRDARACRCDLLGPRPAFRRSTVAEAADIRSEAARRRASASSRRATASSALLDGAGLVGQQLFEARLIRARGRDFRFGGLAIGGRRGRLRLGLADVLGPRAGQQQRQLRRRLRALARTRASERSTSVVVMVATTAPASIRAPSVTFTVASRPPTLDAIRTSVAST